MSDHNEFVTSSAQKYQFKLGKHVASSLSGFIAGAIVASLVWFAVAYFVVVLR